MLSIKPIILIGAFLSLSLALSAPLNPLPSHLPRAQVDVEPAGRKGRVERVDALVLVDADGRGRWDHERFRLHRLADEVEVLLLCSGGRGRAPPPPQLPTFREAAERTTSWAGGRNAAFFPS